MLFWASLTKGLDRAGRGSLGEGVASGVRDQIQERTGPQYVGDMVYGGLDGIITTFAVVSGVAGAQLAPSIILILGLANLFADGFSMATGAYLSLKSEHEYYDRERQHRVERLALAPEREYLELYQAYCRQGYDEAEASQLANIQSRHPEQWVKAMMVEKLGLLPDDRKPLLSGLVTLLSFIVAGSVPLLGYLIGLFISLSPTVVFPTSLILSGLALLGLGAAKVYVTGRSVFRSGLEMLLVGGLAAGVAYSAGAILSWAIG